MLVERVGDENDDKNDGFYDIINENADENANDIVNENADSSDNLAFILFCG